MSSTFAGPPLPANFKNLSREDKIKVFTARLKEALEPLRGMTNTATARKLALTIYSKFWQEDEVAVYIMNHKEEFTQNKDDQPHFQVQLTLLE